MRVRLLITLLVLCLAVVACGSSDPTSSAEYEAVQAELLATQAELDETKSILTEVTAQRDALVQADAAVADRYEKAQANADRIAEIIDSPDAFGTQQEVLDELMTMVAPGAVMDDTAFSAVPMRSAWANTLWGSDATITTWVKWMCDDGSQSGSLWTWSGEANNGELFNLIGVNLDDYDADGKVTYSLVDWPYDRWYVLEAFSSGN